MGLCKEKTTSEKSLQWKTWTKILHSQEELLLWNETQLKNTSPLTFALMLIVETKHKRVECAKKDKFYQELLFSWNKNFKKHLE